MEILCAEIQRVWEERLAVQNQLIRNVHNKVSIKIILPKEIMTELNTILHQNKDGLCTKIAEFN